MRARPLAMIVAFLALVGAVTLPAPAQAAVPTDIALYFDPAFVDTDQEANNTRVALEDGGNAVTTFVGTTLATWGPALDAADVLVVPELEVGNLGAALPADVIAAIQAFTDAGGRVVVFGSGHGASAQAPAFINPVFGFATTSTAGTCNVPCPKTAAAADSEVADGPDTLPNQSATRSLGGLPADSIVLYDDTANAGHAAVAVLPYGLGAVVYIAWDFYNAPPQGAVDGGWIGVLNQMVYQPAIDVDTVITPVVAGEPATFAVSLDGPVSQPVVVDVQTVDGTALAGVEYEAVDTQVTIPAGELFANIAVATLPSASSGTFALEATQASWGQIDVAQDQAEITAPVLPDPVTPPTMPTTTPTTTPTTGAAPVAAQAVRATPAFTG